MGGGGLLAACGQLLLLRVDADADYVTELLPALLVFSVGLSGTVAPLTATVLADADEEHAGIASGVNNAIARAAGLLGVAALGAVIAAQFAGTLDDELAGVPLTPRGEAAVARGARHARSRAPTCSGLPPAEAVPIARATEAAAVSRVPHRHGDQRRARRARRDPRPGARAQPAPRGQLRRAAPAASSRARRSRWRASARRPPPRPESSHRHVTEASAVEVRASHVAMITHPREVTDLVLAAARSGR